VIVVVGDLGARVDALGEIVPAGFAAIVASAAAAAGSRVEVVARLGEDPPGDAVVLRLARAGIGHVATLRDPGRATPILGTAEDAEAPDADEASTSPAAPSATDPTLDAADIGLALRYLSDYRVIVLAHPERPDVLQEAIAAASWTVAHLVLVISPATTLDSDLPASAVAISAERAADATAERVGRYAAAVDGGDDLDTAYAVLTGANTES
jgi:sugar/nucleoside kinase (ribokinase family)